MGAGPIQSLKSRIRKLDHKMFCWTITSIERKYLSMSREKGVLKPTMSKH